VDDSEFTIGFSVLDQIADIIKGVMNPLCSSNVISLICTSWFRECMSVKDDFNRDGGLWLPSLLCRHQCEKHWNIWNECVADLESDPKTKHDFEKQMQAMVCAMPYASFLLPWLFFVCVRPTPPLPNVCAIVFSTCPCAQSDKVALASIILLQKCEFHVTHGFFVFATRV
jgi:hypothetical protein